MKALLFTLLLAATAAAEDAITLADALRIALASHPDVRIAQAGADVLKGRIREVRAQALPEVTIHAGAMRLRDPSLLNASGLDKFPPELQSALVPSGVNLFNYSVGVRQPLYTAGKVGTALRLASIQAEGALAEIDRSQQDLSLSVVRAFYGLLWAERYRNLVAETQKQRELHAEMARTRYRLGVATEVDALRSEVNVANGTAEMVRAENEVHQSRALLNYFLARPTGAPTRVAGEFEEKTWTDGDLEELTRQAFRRRPELAKLRVAERSAATTIDLARAENRMKLDFDSSYGIMSRLPENLGNGQFTRWTFGVNFTLPVFDGFKRSGMVWQATAAQRTTQLERQKAEEQVRLSLQQGLDELGAASQTVVAARANVQQAEKVLAMTQNNYQYGAATTLDIVDAQTALALARTNLLRGLHDYSVARASLRWTAGMTPGE